MKQCNICGEQFENGRTYSNHIRWKHKHTKQFCQYCKKEFSIISTHEPHCPLNPHNESKCKQCGAVLLKNNLDFCNSSCAAKYNNNIKSQTPKIGKCVLCGSMFEYRNRKKKLCVDCYIKQRNLKQLEYNKRLLNLIQNGTTQSDLKYIHTCKCVICGATFLHINDKTKTCGIVCYKKLLSINSKNNTNCGGETNYRKYTYKNIFMDSSWELDIAKWLDEHNIDWQRTRKIMFWWTDINGNKRRYYPDFYLPKYDLYLDPKNKYLLKKDDYKLNQVIKENHINLIYGHKDLILEKLSGL